MNIYLWKCQSFNFLHHCSIYLSALLERPYLDKAMSQSKHKLLQVYACPQGNKVFTNVTPAILYIVCHEWKLHIVTYLS